MKKENAVLMKEAREALSGKWGLAVGAYFMYTLVSCVANAFPKVGGLVSLVISGPLTLGMVIFSLAISRKQNPNFDQVFSGFSRFGTALATYLLVILFTVLWSLLLIIPGIIAAISYSMTFFILAEDNTISPGDAIKKSKKMMYGYKWKFFTLELRFIGWALLSILTLGIGFLWLIPYIQVSVAKFYDDIKEGGEDVIVTPITA